MSVYDAKLIGLIEQAAIRAAQSSAQSTSNVQGVWDFLGEIQNPADFDTQIKAARAHHWAGACPTWEPITLCRAVSADPWPAIGVDGSQVYPDAESPVVWTYVQALAYRTGQPATKFIQGRFFDEEELAGGALFFDVPLQMINTWRNLLEMQTAAQASEMWPGHVTMMDGGLLPWAGVASSQDQRAGAAFNEYMAALESARGRLLVSVVDGPRSGLLFELFSLVYEIAVNKAGDQDESGLSGRPVRDAALMRYALRPGERSALFMHGSPRNEPFEKARMGIYFFFLRLNGEVLRVELPEWIARDPDMVDVVHASVVEDSKQLKYPYTLAQTDKQVRITFDVAQALQAKAEAVYIQHGGRLSYRRVKDQAKGYNR